MKRVGLVLALVLATALTTYALTRPDPPLPAPPAIADTVYVDVIVQDTIWRERVRTVVRDQPNQADTVWQTTTDTLVISDSVYVLPSWYIVAAELPTEKGDTARYLLKLWGVDAGCVLTADRQERHPYPSGPLRALSVDAGGLHVAYGEWPRTRPFFSIGDPFKPLTLLETAAVCGGAGLISQDVLAGLSCAGIKSLLEMLP